MTVPQDARKSGGAMRSIQMLTARLRAIRRTWTGKARRKRCAAKADSCEGSVKEPVMGCITGTLAATASRSGSFSRLSLPGEQRVPINSDFNTLAWNQASTQRELLNLPQFSQLNGGFLLVLAVKKEKKRAPQALAGGRKGTGKG